MPSCSLDDFSGARGPLFGSNGGRIFFHGRHIFSSLLRDLVAKYGIDAAENVVLVGSGNVFSNLQFLPKMALHESEKYGRL